MGEGGGGRGTELDWGVDEDGEVTMQPAERPQLTTSTGVCFSNIRGDIAPHITQAEEIPLVGEDFKSACAPTPRNPRSHRKGFLQFGVHRMGSFFLKS